MEDYLDSDKYLDNIPKEVYGDKDRFKQVIINLI